MSIDPVEALAAAQSSGMAASSAVQNETAVAPGFGRWFTQELQSLNQQMVQAERATQELAAGTATSVHDVMIQLEQARLAFQLVIQVRSRVLEAYQDVMRMQV